MSLAAPWMLLWLPLVALAGWLMARARRLQHAAACRLKGVDAPSVQVGLGRRDGLMLAALACTVLALARPQWSPRPYDVERRGRDLVLALDVSRSMLAADVFPSRLEATRIAILEALPALAGQRIALVTFAGSAAVRVPLTLDHDFVRYMLDRADPSEAELGSTSLQAAVEKAVGSVLTDAAGGRRDLVIFTDGEDHLSNLDKTATLLADCGARVLIVGLGDPVQGARVPAASGPGPWMKYQGADVVSRLDEPTLAKLCGQSGHVTYYPARTRSFDFVSLYQRLIAGAASDVVVGQMRQVRYTEGYPYLLALAAALWLAAASRALPAVRHAVVLVLLLLSGCGRQTGGDEAAMQAKLQRGGELWEHAQEQSAVDLAATHSLLRSAREAYLCAALLHPGDVDAARQITLVTRRLREVEADLAKQRAVEKKRRENLAEVIQRLHTLAVREVRLAQQSRQLLARRPALPPEEFSRLAPPLSGEQQAVREGTAQVLESVQFQQETLRQLLVQSYAGATKSPPTELDPAGTLLAEALAAQQQALEGLAPSTLRWPQANTAFHKAAGRMQQALESLRSLQPPVKDQNPNAPPAGNSDQYDEDLEGPDSGSKGDKSQPLSAGDFQAALALRSLPVPSYTPAEILAEEAANQLRRAKQRAARAAARVEKNW